jgi:hypothetical protein
MTNVNAASARRFRIALTEPQDSLAMTHKNMTVYNLVPFVMSSIVYVLVKVPIRGYCQVDEGLLDRHGTFHRGGRDVEVNGRSSDVFLRRQGR